jgi:hypothetical protein
MFLHLKSAKFTSVARADKSNARAISVGYWLVCCYTGFCRASNAQIKSVPALIAFYALSELEDKTTLQ